MNWGFFKSNHSATPGSELEILLAQSKDDYKVIFTAIYGIVSEYFPIDKNATSGITY